MTCIFCTARWPQGGDSDRVWGHTRNEITLKMTENIHRLKKQVNKYRQDTVDSVF